MNKILDHVKHRVIDYIESDTDSCLNYPFVNKNGYGDIHYRINYVRGHLMAHRVVYQFKNNCILRNDQIIMHLCDNPSCCNPRHLIVGTHKDNSEDMVRKGRQAMGKANGRFIHGRYSKFPNLALK